MDTIEQKPTFTTCGSIQTKDLEELQTIFKQRLEVTHTRDGHVAIKPRARDLQRFRDLLMASGRNLDFIERNLSRRHI